MHSGENRRYNRNNYRRVSLLNSGIKIYLKNSKIREIVANVILEKQSRSERDEPIRTMLLLLIKLKCRNLIEKYILFSLITSKYLKE
jgi:hypothetical protein